MSSGQTKLPLLLGLLLASAFGQLAVQASPALTSGVNAGAERPFQLLEHMARALKTTDFEGTLVYQFGGALSAMRIVHRYEDGASQESLLTLNGPIRTIGRNGRAVACLLSGGQALLLNHHDQPQTQASGSEGEVMPPDWRDLAVHYRFELLNATRVAGRTVDVVGILPRDNLRYGYRFSIDRASYLPLGTALTDAQGNPIQQLMFTDVRLIPGTESDASASQPDVAASPAKATLAAEPIQPSDQPLDDEPPALEAASPQTASASRWRFSDLPAGFALRAHEWMESDSGAPIEYFLFSDGLASVSLYVEQSEQAGLVGQTQMATIHAAGRWVQGYQMTAVGEVPAATVTALLDALDTPSGKTPQKKPQDPPSAHTHDDPARRQ